jgi:putative hydrolase of the HAD superfamily
LPERPAAVVLDYGHVLSRPQPPAAVARLEALSGLPGEVLWPAYWGERVPYDRGVVDGAGYWAAVAARLGRQAWPAATVAELVAADVASWSHVDPAMVAWAGALGRAGVATALLSNAPPELAAFIVERFAWVAGLDGRTFSCDLGAVKPEPAIYASCLAAIGVDPADTLLVDDRAANVAGAVEFGMRGHVFTTRAALADALRGSGLPLPA